LPDRETELEEGRRGFVLNLADVPYIDSFGLGQMVAMWNSDPEHRRSINPATADRQHSETAGDHEAKQRFSCLYRRS